MLRHVPIGETEKLLKLKARAEKWVIDRIELREMALIGDMTEILGYFMEGSDRIEYGVQDGLAELRRHVARI